MHIIIWLSFEAIMLSDRSQSQRTTYFRFPFTWQVQNMQTHTDRKSTSGLQGQGERKMGMLANWYEVSFCKDKNLLKLDISDVYINLCIYEKLNRTLKW